MLFKEIKNLIGNDVLEVFGDSGTGKSTFVSMIIVDALQSNIKDIFIIDTERNFHPQTVFGAQIPFAYLTSQIPRFNYQYVPSFREIVDNFNNWFPKTSEYKLIVVDSIGAPILSLWSRADLSEKGKVLQQLFDLCYRFKVYAKSHETLVILTNQPKSELSKVSKQQQQQKTLEELLSPLWPFGGKHKFQVKEIWKSTLVGEVTINSTPYTKCVIETFRSRIFRRGVPLFEVLISDTNVMVRQLYSFSVTKVKYQDKVEEKIIPLKLNKPYVYSLSIDISGDELKFKYERKRE